MEVAVASVGLEEKEVCPETDGTSVRSEELRSLFLLQQEQIASLRQEIEALKASKGAKASSLKSTEKPGKTQADQNSESGSPSFERPVVRFGENGSVRDEERTRRHPSKNCNRGRSFGTSISLFRSMPLGGFKNEVRRIVIPVRSC